MKRFTFALALLLAAATAFAKRPITEKDLFRFVWIGDPQVSPDGAQVAFVRVTVDEKNDRYDTSIWSVAARGGDAPRPLTSGKGDRSPRWSPDGKTLAFLRSGGDGADGKPLPQQIWLLPMGGGEPRAITTFPQAVESIEWSPDGRTIAFTATTRADDFDEKKKDEGEHVSDVHVVTQALFRDNSSGQFDFTRNTHIWTVAVPTSASEVPAKPKQLTSGEFDEDQPVWSPDGTRLYFVSTRTRESYYDPEDADLYAVPAAGGDLVEVADLHGPISAPQPSPDGTWIAFAGWESNSVRSYNPLDLFVVPASGGAAKNLTEAYDYDVQSGPGGDQRAPRGSGRRRLIWSTSGDAVLVTTAEQGRGNVMRVDIANGRVTPFTRGNQDVMAFDVRGGTAVALVGTPTRIGDLFRVDAAGAQTQLTDVNKTLFDDLDISAPEEIWYTSFDGRKIEGWIQKPPGFDPNKKYPLILNIHGGPHSAYGYTFDHEFHWMAAKGYVVLYPNPRGSSSYGLEFGNVIQYKYPGDDYKDLMAGVDAVVARGYIDPKKLGVTGGSGGGLLTNWVITQTDRFAAAVSQRSISDWTSFWYVADFTQFTPFWFRKAPWQDPQDYVARSPITYVEKIHTPLMLIEGESDLRTPQASGGEPLFRALKYLHRPVVMVRFPGETHELSRSGKPWHRIERLEHIVGWFDQWVMGVPSDAYKAGLR